MLPVITLRASLLIAALALCVSPTFAQTAQTPIEPCPSEPAKPAITAPAPTKTGATAKQTVVDSNIPDDPAVEKLLAPYTEKVRALNVVIGKLDGGLKREGAGSGSLGNFITDGMRAQAQAKLGKPVTLAIMNGGGIRKSEISPGELRAADIFELLPFENGLIALEMNGAQLAKLIQVATRDAQSGARIQFKWNDQNRAEFLSGKLVDENGKEQEIDPQKMYTVVTIDYLVKLGSGAYTLLQEAKSTTPLNITLRESIMNYVKAETAAGRTIQPRTDDRFVQIGPDRKTPEEPR